MMIVQNLSLAGRCEKGIQSLLCTFHWTLIPLPNRLRILCSHLRDYENKFWTIIRTWRSKMLPYSPHNTSSFWISNHCRVTLVTDFTWLLYSFIMSSFTLLLYSFIMSSFTWLLYSFIMTSFTWLLYSFIMSSFT